MIGETEKTQADIGLRGVEERDLERWRNENRKSFESYNEMIEGGLLSDDMGVI
ncbi:hypothetical protein GMPD_39600 [Geomonas paludis]|uniref:Uncharacterized protein n=1 Tax=Geomonas paludis TaxID=2740185 RepID=A0A6V8N0X0_9BACT|nr:hypothetical protein GMPD_39600 [Geomonas paludis]